MRKKVIISFSAGVILVMIVTIGAILGGKDKPNNDVVQVQSTPSPIVEVVETPAPTEAPEEIVAVIKPTASPEATETPFEVFTWLEVEATDQKYTVNEDVTIFTEPRTIEEGSEKIKLLPAGSIFTFDNLITDAAGNELPYGKLVWEDEEVTGYVSLDEVELYVEVVVEDIVQPTAPPDYKPELTKEETDAINDALGNASLGLGGWTIGGTGESDNQSTPEQIEEVNDWIRENGIIVR